MAQFPTAPLYELKTESFSKLCYIKCFSLGPANGFRHDESRYNHCCALKEIVGVSDTCSRPWALCAYNSMPHQSKIVRRLAEFRQSSSATIGLPGSACIYSPSSVVRCIIKDVERLAHCENTLSNGIKRSRGRNIFEEKTIWSPF